MEQIAKSAFWEETV